MGKMNRAHIQYEPTWDSLRACVVPEWFQDAKLGIFIHWGVYAVPAFGNEWYPRNMYLQGRPEFEHHRQVWGDQKDFGYKDLIPLFKAEKWDPDAWVDLFKKAGARYVVPVAEHHDGFAMYDCSLSEWNAARMGPRRDIVGELAEATRRQGLVPGVSSHRAEHWWFMNGGRAFESDVCDPRYAGLYGPAMPYEGEWKSRDWVPRPDARFLDDWLARTCELVDKYRPQVVWFDWWIEQTVFQPYLQKFAAYYYNRGAEWDKGVVINYKHESFPEGAAVYDIERGKLNDIRPRYWQTDTSISFKSWGYIEDDEFRSVTSVVHDLADIVSKNGNLLLNVGPRADGTIPQGAADVLLGLGQWLAVNGEAIYGTRPWRVFGEGPTGIPQAFREREQQSYTVEDVRFTARGNALYAICLDWPADGVSKTDGVSAWTIKSLGTNGPLAEAIAHISLLGSHAPLTWSRDEQGLRIERPPAKPCDHAYTFKIVLGERPA